MEIVYILIILLLTGIIFCLLWRNRCLKRDIYEFAEKLEISLQELLNGKKPDKAEYRRDDLWARYTTGYAAFLTCIRTEIRNCTRKKKI